MGLLIFNGGLYESLLADFRAGRHEAFAATVSAPDLEEDVAHAEDEGEYGAENAESGSCHGSCAQVLGRDYVLELRRAGQHTNRQRRGAERGAGVQPPGDVKILKQGAGQGNHDEDGYEDVDAAVGEDDLDAGDAGDSQELCCQRILSPSGNAGDLNGYGSCGGRVAHDLRKQSAEQEEHKVAF